MAIQLASPGIRVREVDLTRGGVNATTNVAAGIAAPFRKGPVNQIVRVRNEKELVDIFGKPGVGTTDYHYESWYAASNFLSYGGQLEVVRASGGELNNSNAGVGLASTATLLVENFEDFNNNNYNDTTWYYAAKNPGNWAENLKVCLIDNAADQRIGGLSTITSTSKTIQVGYAVTQSLDGVKIGIGTTSNASGYLKGVVTGVSTGFFDVKITSYVSGVGNTEYSINYQQNSLYEFKTGVGYQLGISSVTFGDAGIATGSVITSSDWYDQQNALTSVADGGQDAFTISWRSLLPKPQTTAYTSTRGGSNDALNIVVIDAAGTVTGSVGAVLEKFGNLSKAFDSEISPQKSAYYKDYIAENSEYIFAGLSPARTDAYWGTSAKPSGFSSGIVPIAAGAGSWGQNAQGIAFNSIGNVSYRLTGGKDYRGVGYFDCDLGDLLTAYDNFSDPVNSDIRFLLQGGANKSKEDEQAKANKLISICELRKDCVTFISPNRGSVVNVSSASRQLTNVLSFFAPISSSSYAVFDSGYQYMYDRWNKKYIYTPISNDIAGLCVRTDINQFPWFSPAGSSRGNLNYAIKLAFNPTQDDRDRLYSSRINPVISSPGGGIILFGDKTGLAYESAFDRINVRRLFITIETAIANAAKAQLFEFNDAGTRSNFANIVEPYLRDVKAKRGIFDFQVVCDDTNNTPDVIDRNEFIADIYVKPARSINYIGLTFVATRTGIAFSEVIGTV
jgi:hypothetical protein